MKSAYQVHPANYNNTQKVEKAICAQPTRRGLVIASTFGLATAAYSVFSTISNTIRPCDSEKELPHHPLTPIAAITAGLGGLGHFSLAIFMLCNDSPVKKVSPLMMCSLVEIGAGLSTLFITYNESDLGGSLNGTGNSIDDKSSWSSTLVDDSSSWSSSWGTD